MQQFGSDLKILDIQGNSSRIEWVEVCHQKIPYVWGEFWTSKQRQSHSLHEISYRACFKPDLVRFFVERFSKEGDMVYDPFSGRGTTVLESALLGRNVIANDLNPLSEIFSRPRVHIPDLKKLEERMEKILSNEKKSEPLELDLKVFFHEKTLQEILSFREYLKERSEKNQEDSLDSWIRMVATNRLTGHSIGFFSVYTLPPNQATGIENQIRINQKRSQKPEYRSTSQIILKKTRSLLRDLTQTERNILKKIQPQFLRESAQNTSQIPDNSVHLTVTSPPFLDIVNYRSDNWLRAWFNSIDLESIPLTVTSDLDEWCRFIGKVLAELFRITQQGAWVAFEVGELKNGTLDLSEYVLDLGISAGFSCYSVLYNSQSFTKTSHIWGVSNNRRGTNSNRIVLFQKDTN